MAATLHRFTVGATPGVRVAFHFEIRTTHAIFHRFIMRQCGLFYYHYNYYL